MRRKNFMRLILPITILPIASIYTIGNLKIRFPYKSEISWEVFGNESINKSEYNFETYLKESYNLNSDEYKIDFESGKITDFDCLQEYEDSNDFSKMIFCIDFEIYFTHSGFKKFKS